MAFLLFVDGLLVLWLPVRVVVGGALVGAVSLLYLLMQHRLHWVKGDFWCLSVYSGYMASVHGIGFNRNPGGGLFCDSYIPPDRLIELTCFPGATNKKIAQISGPQRQLNGGGQLDQWIRLVWILQILICLIAWYNFKVC